jgi:hypothetical protein
MINNPSNVSVAQLRQALEIREQIERLENQLAGILGGTSVSAPSRPAGRPAGKRGMSEEGRRRIIEAQKARWAIFHAQKSGAKGKSTAPATQPKRKMSAAARARIAATAKARWAKAKAAGKKRL